MQKLVVVAYPEPLAVEARPVEHEAAPEGHVALAYYFRGNLIARGVVVPEVAEAIRLLLSSPISVALAAAEDEDGNIEGRVCLVLPAEVQRSLEEGSPEPVEPWLESLAPPPPEINSSYRAESEEAEPQLALLPIGNVLRPATHRNHPEDVSGDAKEMLEVLLAGKARDAVQKAIDDLLGSI